MTEPAFPLLVAGGGVRVDGAASKIGDLLSGEMRFRISGKVNRRSKVALCVLIVGVDETVRVDKPQTPNSKL